LPVLKKKTIPKLKKDLDAIFSKYIRLKYSKNGITHCYTCGRPHEWKWIQNGHYVSRRYTATRWDEGNCKPQCISCNLYNEGMKNVFAINLVREYGVEHLEKLEIKKNNKSKMDRFAYETLINDYKEKVSKLTSV